MFATICILSAIVVLLVIALYFSFNSIKKCSEDNVLLRAENRELRSELIASGRFVKEKDGIINDERKRQAEIAYASSLGNHDHFKSTVGILRDGEADTGKPDSTIP